MDQIIGQVDSRGVKATACHGASGHGNALARPVTGSARAPLPASSLRLHLEDGSRLSLRMTNEHLWVADERLRGDVWVVVGIYHLRNTRCLEPSLLRRAGIPVWTTSTRIAIFDFMAANIRDSWRRRTVGA